MGIPAEVLLITLVVGLTAGLLAGQIVERDGLGLFGDLLIGVVGAALGGWLLPRLGILPGAGTLGAGTLGATVNGAIGAAVLLPLAGYLRGRAGWLWHLLDWGPSGPHTRGGGRLSRPEPERKR